MSLEAIKEFLPKQKDIRHWTTKPHCPGTFRVLWHGWHKLAASFMTWDGEQWVDLEERRKHHKLALSKTHAEMGIFYPGDFFWIPEPLDVGLSENGCMND